MKKELLMASALVGSMGFASAADAITYTISGNHGVGVEFDSLTGGTDTNAVIEHSSFAIALSEVTDAGTTISSSFHLANEADGMDNDTALTLTFAGGTKLDIFNAGNASGGHDVSVPGSGGEEGVTVTTTNNAPSGLDFQTGSTELGIELHSGADFLTDGLKMSASISTDTGAAATATARADSHWAIGATYVTDAGDTAITFGTGISSTDYSKTGTSLTQNAGGFHIGVSTVTGDLTIAVGFGDGDSIADDGASGNGNASTQVDGEVIKAGIKYLVGADDEITLQLGFVAGTAQDSDTIGTAGTNDDSYDKTSASVSYAVADGVTAMLGYSSVDSSDEGATDSGSKGSAWYIGANMAF